jgi:iron complex transport system substrate-binding protein
MRRTDTFWTRTLSIALVLLVTFSTAVYAQETTQHRIVSLAPNWTQTVVELGGLDQLVGVSRYSIFPDSIPRLVEEGRLTDIGGFLDIDTALVNSLHPDLALTSTQLQRRYHGWLKQHGITIIHVDEKSLQESYDRILDLGKFIGRQAEAEQMVDGIKKQLDEIAAEYADVPRVRVYYEINYFYKCVPGANSYITELMKIAGADPIYSERPGIAPSVTWEEAVAKNPEVILIPWWATGGDEGPHYEGPQAGNGTTTPYRIAHREGADRVDAVKNGKVRFIDSAKTKQAGPMIPVAARLFAEAIHAPGDMKRLELNIVPKDIHDQ